MKRTQMVQTPEPEKQLYTFTEYGITIEAESASEARRILAKRLEEAKTIPLTPNQ